jgi:adenylate cyclase class 2
MIEKEIKFLVDDFTPYREKLEQLNIAREASFFEENIIFDDAQGSLKREGRLLRLRKSNAATLTFKEPVARDRFKVMEEHEVEVSDFHTALKIVNSLGFKKVFRYQKRRDTYRTGDTLILFDETPIGNYIEIEGGEESILHVCNTLDLEIGDGISSNYMELYAEYCRTEGLKPSDMVFH